MLSKNSICPARHATRQSQWVHFGKRDYHSKTRLRMLLRVFFSCSEFHHLCREIPWRIHELVAIFLLDVVAV